MPPLTCLRGMEHVVVVVPVDADVDEAQHVAQEDRQQRAAAPAQVVAVRHLQLQHHDGDDDGEHAVAEGLEPVLSHDMSIVGLPPPLFDKRSLGILLEGQAQFLLGVHDDGAVPGDRFVEGLARDEQEADRPVPRRDCHLVAVAFVEHDGLRAAEAASGRHPASPSPPSRRQRGRAGRRNSPRRPGRRRRPCARP